MTIYRLAPTDDLASRLRAKYVDRDDFSVIDVEVGAASGLLIAGQIRNPRARWADTLAHIAGEALDLGNDTAAAVLLLPVGEAVYALCYGMGYHLIDYDSVDPGFGLQYAARVLQPDDLRSVTRHTMDRQARIERRSIPGGGDARAFGLADFGTVASKVVGKTVAAADGQPAATIRGADGLSAPVGRTPHSLVGDLHGIEQTLRQAVSHPDLALLTRVTPLMQNDSRKRTLNARLAAALRGEVDDPLLGTGWPWEQADEFTIVESVRLLVPGDEDRLLQWLTIDDLTDLITNRRARDPISLLRAVKVILSPDSEGGEAASPRVPATKWIAFETRLDDRLFFFHDGRWFVMAIDYEQQVRSEVERILSAPAPVGMPSWPAGQWEPDYAQAVSATDPRFLLLDRDLIHTKMNPRGIEHCDLLGPGNEFIHVKRLRRSQEASHLFAQALVATENLLFDPEARIALRTKVANRSGGSRTAPETPSSVVLAIGRPTRLTVDTLFTFSQVTLLRLVQHLESRGVKVSVVSVPHD